MAKAKAKPKIKKEKCEPECCGDTPTSFCKGGVIYFLGFIGVAIYYISSATGFWMGVLGFLKALVWPVFLVLEALKFMLG